MSVRNTKAENRAEYSERQVNKLQRDLENLEGTDSKARIYGSRLLSSSSIKTDQHLESWFRLTGLGPGPGLVGLISQIFHLLTLVLALFVATIIIAYALSIIALVNLI